MADSDDLFGDPAESARDARPRDEMLRRLRAPWGDSPPRIPEPSDDEKVAYCEAFIGASQPRLAP